MTVVSYKPRLAHSLSQRCLKLVSMVISGRVSSSLQVTKLQLMSRVWPRS
jgi:hypothetical protein